MSLKDLHTHILHGVDDGAKNEKECFDMLFDSFNQGVDCCALTPHCIIHSETAIEDFLQKRNFIFDTLKNKLEGKDVPKIFLGAEVYTDHDISEHKDIEKLRIGSTPYILVEPSFKTKYEWLADTVYSLNLKGLIVIIAHIDRYPMWREIMRELEGLKVIYQINASRFLSFMGRRIIKKLLRYEEHFIVSTDMHNMTTRRCNIKEAFEKASKMDKTVAKNLFLDTGLILE